MNRKTERSQFSRRLFGTLVVFFSSVFISRVGHAEEFSKSSIELYKKLENAFKIQLEEISKMSQQPASSFNDTLNSIQSDIEKINAITVTSDSTSDFFKAVERAKSRVSYIASALSPLVWQAKNLNSTTTFTNDQLYQIQRGVPEQINFFREDILNLEKTFGNFSFNFFNPNFVIILFLSLLSAVSVFGFLRYYKLAQTLRDQNLLIMNRFESNEKTYQHTIEYLKKVNETTEHTTKEIQNLEQKMSFIIPDNSINSTSSELKSSVETLLQIIETQKGLISNTSINASKQSSYDLVISDLVRFVEDISSKSKVVHDIAFKTKVLSFNASVEAERAGVRGRGFSIVAQEMKRLAEISGKASEEIAAIVERTRRGTQQLSNSDTSKQNDMQNSLSEVQSNFEKMESVASEFKDYLNTIYDVQDSTKQNLQEASNMIQQLNHAQEQLRIINDEIFHHQQPWAS